LLETDDDFSYGLDEPVDSDGDDSEVDSEPDNIVDREDGNEKKSGCGSNISY
jgi:hypothetical protein